MHNFFRKLAGVLATTLAVTTLFTATPAMAANKTASIAPQTAKSSAESISSVTIGVGQTVDLKFYGIVDYKDTGIGWTSSNKTIATVDKNGVITAKKVGTAQVVYSAYGYSVTPVTVNVVANATLSFEYLKKDTTPEKTELLKVSICDQDTKAPYTEYTLKKVGATKDFSFVGAKGYSTATHKCKWGTTDPKVATVDNVGLVKAVGDGETQLFLTITDKAGNPAYEVIPVKIIVSTVVDLKVTDVKQNSFSIELPEGYEAIKTIFSFDPALIVKSMVYESARKINFTTENLVSEKAYTVSASENGTTFAKGEIKYVAPANVTPSPAATNTPTPVPTEAAFQARIGAYDDTFDKARTNPVISVSDRADNYLFVRYQTEDGKFHNVTPDNFGYTDNGRVTFSCTEVNILGVSEDGNLEARGVGSANVAVYLTPSDSTTTKLLGVAKITVTSERVMSTVSLREIGNGWTCNSTSAKVLSTGYIPGYNKLYLNYLIKDQLGEVYCPETVELTATYQGKDASDFFKVLEADTDGTVNLEVDNRAFNEDGKRSYDVTLGITYKDGNNTKKMTYRVTIFNTLYLVAHKNDARTYSVVWANDISSLGLIGNEAFDSLEGEVMLLINFDGVPVSVVEADGDYETAKDESYNVEEIAQNDGKLYISIKRNSEYLAPMQIATGAALTVDVYGLDTTTSIYNFSLRDAFAALTSGDYTEDAVALGKIKSTNVIVKLFQFTSQGDGTRYTFKNVATLTKTFSNTDSATVNVDVKTDKVDYMPDDWTTWLEENCVTTIKVGDEISTISTVNGFSDAGIIAEVVRYSDTSNFVVSVDFYIPVGYGYIYKSVPIRRVITATKEQ